ncbi:MAG: hypothetical protein D6710_03610 [Nitrospirae bacterium]|nr:MAG: hypothetical protein D6710_03610 [Nitrospirota bacterium]
MQAYRYQEIAYLVVPIMLGYEFFRTARDEKRGKEETPIGSYVLDFFGFLFITLVPALFLFTIWAIEKGKYNFGVETLARFDRYGVMFMFMGAWWQVYIIAALRARRLQRENKPLSLWGPFLGLGIFISLLVLWVSPWGLKWVSVGWFIGLTGLLWALKVKPRTLEKLFWGLAIFTFFLENIVFIWLESIV